MISERFESLAQSFRVFAEQQLRFSRLILVDAPEAVGNLDHAIDGIFNSFHGLFDAVKAEAKEAFNFYDDPLCAFVLRLRNARHHNQANGLRNVYRRARLEDVPVDYLLVNFSAGDGEKGGTFAEYYISWADILAVHAAQPEKYARSIASGREAIRAGQFEAWCRDQGYIESQIFVNLIPILSGACSSCMAALTEFVDAQSVEAEAFFAIFTQVEMANFGNQSYCELTSAAFWPK